MAPLAGAMLSHNIQTGLTTSSSAKFLILLHYGSGLSAPVDGAMLKVAHTTNTILRRKLITRRIAQRALFPTKAGPFVSYGSMDFMRTCLWGPVDGASLEMIEATSSIRSSCLISEWVPQE